MCKKTCTMSMQAGRMSTGKNENLQHAQMFLSFAIQTGPMTGTPRSLLCCGPHEIQDPPRFWI